MRTILLRIFILLGIQVIACYDSNYFSVQYTSINCDQSINFRWRLYYERNKSSVLVGQITILNFVRNKIFSRRKQQSFFPPLRISIRNMEKVSYTMVRDECEEISGTSGLIAAYIGYYQRSAFSNVKQNKWNVSSGIEGGTTRNRWTSMV